jgi:hypothetical protein
MPLKCQSGEEIMKGDRVLYGGDPGVIKLVADPLIHDPDTRWYVEKFGGGVMISELKIMGSVFVDAPDSDDDLQFVSRAVPDSREIERPND